LINVGNGQLNQISMSQVCNTLDCMHDQQIVMGGENMVLRRLTPLECCRLQGFPDWWTVGVEGSDSAQYKMWGNGIALPCAVDVMRRVVILNDQGGESINVEKEEQQCMKKEV
jgi:DNA (cytosine-5)-methyltransferase 1